MSNSRPVDEIKKRSDALKAAGGVARGKFKQIDLQLERLDRINKMSGRLVRLKGLLIDKDMKNRAANLKDINTIKVELSEPSKEVPPKKVNTVIIELNKYGKNPYDSEMLGKQLFAAIGEVDKDKKSAVVTIINMDKHLDKSKIKDSAKARINQLANLLATGKYQDGRAMNTTADYNDKANKLINFLKFYKDFCADKKPERQNSLAAFINEVSFQALNPQARDSKNAPRVSKLDGFKINLETIAKTRETILPPVKPQVANSPQSQSVATPKPDMNLSRGTAGIPVARRAGIAGLKASPEAMAGFKVEATRVPLTANPKLAISSPPAAAATPPSPKEASKPSTPTALANPLKPGQFENDQGVIYDRVVLGAGSPPPKPPMKRNVRNQTAPTPKGATPDSKEFVKPAVAEDIIRKKAAQVENENNSKPEVSGTNAKPRY